MDASDAGDVCAGTSALPVAEVARLTRERRMPSLRPPLTLPDGLCGGCPVLGAGRCWPGDLAPM